MKIVEHIEMMKTSQTNLRNVIEHSLQTYFSHLDPETPPSELYDFVIKEVEIPLLQNALNYTNGNQLKAASLLGISRNTLRRKLIHYQINGK